MIQPIKDALNALLSNKHIETLKDTDVTLALLCEQINIQHSIIEDINLEEEENKDCALISLYLFLWYLNTYHVATLAAVAKEYLRLR